MPLMIIVGTIVLIRFLFFKNRNSTVKSKNKTGIRGELKTKKLIKKTFKNKNVLIFNDLLLKNNLGKTTQIDHLVINGKDIYVFETKNFNGWVVGKYNDDDWTIIYSNKKYYKIFSPFLQNQGHINFLQKELKDTYNFYNVVVLPNKKTSEFKINEKNDKKRFVLNNHHSFKKFLKDNYFENNNPPNDLLAKKINLLNIKSKKELKKHVNNLMYDKKIRRFHGK